MRMWMKMGVFGLVFALTGCDVFYEMEVPVVGSNPTPYEIGILINGKGVGPIIAPHSSAFFTAVVQIPNPPNDPTALVDLVTDVSIAVYNFDKRRQTETVRCKAGAKIHTNVEYTVSEGDNRFREDVDCWRTYTY